MPSWAPPGTKNLRGIVPPSTAHYMGIVGLGQGVLEGIFDTGGARSMIDKNTAELLGLTVEKAKSGTDFGGFIGPGGNSQKYYGRVVGPLKMQL